MKVYLWDYSLVAHGDLEKHLSATEIKSLKCMKSLKRKKEFSAGRFLTRSLLKNSDVSVSPTGKPSVSSGPAFNLSHSVNMILFAMTSNGDIGADLEQESTEKPIEGLLRKIATPNEIMSFSELPKDQLSSSFFKLWVLKEAFVKYSGQGVGLGRLKESGFNIEGSTWSPAGELEKFKFVYFGFEDFHGAVCVKASEFTLPRFYSVSIQAGRFEFVNQSLSFEVI